MRTSIALCTFNGEKYLPAQLASFLSQTVLPTEIVIVDDGSCDGTPEILRAFASTAPCIVRIYNNQVRLGPIENFGEALRHCSHDVVLFSDQDDVWLPSKVELFTRAFEDPECLVVASNASLIDASGQLMNQDLWSTVALDRDHRHLTGQGLVQQLLVRGNFVAGMSMGVRRDFALSCLPVADGWYHDGWIALCAAVRSGLRLIDRELAQYRQHESNVVGVPKKTSAVREVIALFGRDKRRTLELVHRQSLSTGERLAHELTADQILFLATRGEHFKARWKLPRSRLLRVPSVLAEYRSGRYDSMSLGLRSAIRDLLRAI